MSTELFPDPRPVCPVTRPWWHDVERCRCHNCTLWRDWRTEAMAWDDEHEVPA